jgi:hypothetical protein
MGVKESHFVRLCLALDEGECKIATQDGSTLAGEPIGEACCKRCHACDCHTAERDTGDKNIEPMQTAAQFAKGKAEW